MKKYLQKFINFFRTAPVSVYPRIVSLEAAVIERDKEIDKLRQALNSRSERRIDVIDFHDGEPQDEEARQVYVASVANFHEDILRRRLIKNIADVREQLASMDYSGIPDSVPREAFDWYLRGTENALWLIYEWGELKSGEHKSNIG